MNEKMIVKVGGMVDPIMFSDVVEVVVDSSVFLPAMCTVTLRDSLDPITHSLKYTDNAAKYRIGASLDVLVVSENIDLNGMPEPNVLFIGEITAIEPIFGRDGQVSLKIRGYDRAHRLTYGKKTRTFGSGLPFSTSEGEIITKIIQQHGLTPVVDPTLLAIRADYVIQYNQSDWDFLWARAQMLGYQIFVVGRICSFIKASLTRPGISPGALSWGKNLVKFEPRIVTAGQISGVDVYGWDPKQKRGVSIKSAPLKSSAKIPGALIPGNITVKQAFSGQNDAIINPDLSNPALAKLVGQARFDRAESQFVRASGDLSDCNPYLVAGTTVTVKDVGIRFTGKYHITQARHSWRSGQYSIHFEVSGRNPYTIRHLLNGDEKSSEHKIEGVVVGVVTDLMDPMMLGRVKVKFPWMPKSDGAELASSWARLAVTGGGKDRGIYFSPEVDDEVLVAFEHGNMNFPYILGVLWNSKDKPAKGSGLVIAGSMVNQRIIRSRSGHLILMDDTLGKEQITIVDKTGNNKVEINSLDNSMKINAQGNLTIGAMGSVTISGNTGVEIKSNSKIDVSSMGTLNVKGMTSTLEGTGSMTVKNGTGAQVAMNGPIVNINNGALEVM